LLINVFFAAAPLSPPPRAPCGFAQQMCPIRLVLPRAVHRPPSRYPLEVPAITRLQADRYSPLLAACKAPPTFPPADTPPPQNRNENAVSLRGADQLRQRRPHPVSGRGAWCGNWERAALEVLILASAATPPRDPYPQSSGCAPPSPISHNQVPWRCTWLCKLVRATYRRAAPLVAVQRHPELFFLSSQAGTTEKSGETALPAADARMCCWDAAGPCRLRASRPRPFRWGWCRRTWPRGCIYTTRAFCPPPHVYGAVRGRYSVFQTPPPPDIGVVSAPHEPGGARGRRWRPGAAHCACEGREHAWTRVVNLGTRHT
jgi:hypothetical protein